MHQQVTVALLSAASATSGSIRVDFDGEWLFDVAGTFGGATVGLQLLGPDGSTWIDVRDSAGALAFTAAGAVVVSLPVGQYRATVTGGTGVSVSARLRSVNLL